MTKFLNISTDNTLGGNSPSNETVSSQKAIKEYADTKQEQLVSGTNIKTINSNSVLGSGNLTPDDLVPSQTGNKGKFLATTGTNVGWTSTLLTDEKNYGIYIQSTVADGTAAPSDSLNYFFRAVDNNNQHYLGQLRFPRTTSGAQYASLQAFNYISGSEANASFNIGVTSSGQDFAEGTAGVKYSILDWAYPSGTGEAITLAASGTVYEATNDGWVVFQRRTGTANAYATLYNDTNNAFGTFAESAASNAVIRVMLPVRKGDKFGLAYTASGTGTSFQFIKAVGA